MVDSLSDPADPAGPFELTNEELQQMFPRRWLSGALDGDEVQDVCNVVLRDGPPATQAVIGLGWTPARTARLIKDCTRALARPETWRPEAQTWIMSLHRTDKPAADTPLGFVGFRPWLAYDPDAGRFLRFHLNLDLAWVIPALRGKGYGLHLVAHLLRYLETHPVPASHFGNTLRGLQVTIARPSTPDCRWVGARLAASFEQDGFLTKGADAEGLPLPAWPVISLEVEDDD